MADSFRKQIANEASKAFWDRAFRRSATPQAEDWKSATESAQRRAFSFIEEQADAQSRQFPEEVGTFTTAQRQRLPGDLEKLAPPLDIPQLPPHMQLRTWRLMVAAAVGAVVGVIALGAATRWLLDLRDVGVFLGGPAGAATFVWLALTLSRDRFAKSLALLGLSAALVTDLTILIFQGGSFARIRSLVFGARQGGRGRRMLVYLLIGLFVLLMKREPSVDENVAKRIVDAALDTWAGGLLGALRSRHAAAPAVSDSSSLDPLLPTLANLRHCSPERREEFVDQLLSDCENNGIRFPSLPPHEVTASGYRVVRWKDELDLEFNRFGEIGPGDKALILRGPIEHNGQLHKGLVKRHTGT